MQGVAFSGIPSRTYYPALSLYGGARARANFGPTWIFPPPESLLVEEGVVLPSTHITEAPPLTHPAPGLVPLRSLCELKPPLTKQEAASRVEEVSSFITYNVIHYQMC